MSETPKEKAIRIYGKEPESLDELAECVITNINSQFPSIKVIRLYWSLVWNFWGRGDSWDSRFFHGRVCIRYSDQSVTSQSSYEHLSVIMQVGHGGRRCANPRCRRPADEFTWQIRFYQKDWALAMRPHLKAYDEAVEEYERYKVWAILGDGRYPYPPAAPFHRFLWTAENDRNFD